MILTVALTTVAAGPSAYVVNSYGETLSRIDLTTGTVDVNVLTLGSDIECAPNQIVIRDTMAYVINSVCDEIQVINLVSESTVRYINLPVGSNPYWMAFYDDQYAYVTLLMHDAIIKVDIVTGQVMGQVSVGESPGGVVIANHKAYIGITAMDDEFQYGQGMLTIYDCQGGTLLDQFNVGTNPNNLAVDSAGRVHVVCSGDYSAPYGYVYVIDTDSDTIIDSLYLGGTGYDTPGPISIGPDNVAYVTAGGWASSGKLYAYDAHTLEIFHDVSNPIPVTIGCMGAQAYQDSSVFAISFYNVVERTDTSGTIAATYAVGVGPVHLAFNYMPGDIDGSFLVDGADLSILIDMLFISLREPTYLKWRANLNNDFMIDGADLSIMIQNLFIQPGYPMTAGPTWLR